MILQDASFRISERFMIKALFLLRVAPLKIDNEEHYHKPYCASSLLILLRVTNQITTAIINIGQNTPIAAITTEPIINRLIKINEPNTLKIIAKAISTKTTIATAEMPIAFKGLINSPSIYTLILSNSKKPIPNA